MPCVVLRDTVAIAYLEKRNCECCMINSAIEDDVIVPRMKPSITLFVGKEL